MIVFRWTVQSCRTEQMARVMLENPLQQATRTLIHMACDAGGDDNITVVMFRVEEL